MTFDIRNLRQGWDKPANPAPIVIIGAGGIVNDAHLPAYRKAGFHVAGVYDLDVEKARDTAARWDIPVVFERLDDAVREPNVVFDLASPPSAMLPVLEALPDGAAVLIQKPMGHDLAHAQAIVRCCESRRLVAAVNHQLRFAPSMLAVRDAIRRGWLGRISDIDVHLNIADPWHLFPFLETLDRVEILVHSIHYVDLIRSLLGEPQGVYALTVPDARFPKLKSTRSSIVLNYGDSARVSLSLNHNYAHGEHGQSAMFKFEGTDGVMWVQIGVVLDYPKGKPDKVEIKLRGEDWAELPLSGTWFPDAFIGPMSNLQRFVAGEDRELVTSVRDVLRTMAVVEAAYQSSASGGTPLPRLD